MLLGLVVGWIGFRAMRSIDEYNVELMISLAIVMGGYSLAQGSTSAARSRWRSPAC